MLVATISSVLLVMVVDTIVNNNLVDLVPDREFGLSKSAFWQGNALA